MRFNKILMPLRFSLPGSVVYEALHRLLSSQLMYLTTPQHAILHAGGSSASDRILELGAIGDHTNREFTSLVNTHPVRVSSLCIASFTTSILHTSSCLLLLAPCCAAYGCCEWFCCPHAA